MMKAYVGKCKHGKVFAVCVQDAAEKCAADIADWLKDGGTIELISVEEAKKLWGDWPCRECEPVEAQQPLFG